MDAKKVAQYGLITALALVLSWAESLLPPLGAPGVKLGLPNLAIVFALYRLGWKDACAVSLVRVVLVALLFGNGAALAYSIAGAALSLALMGVLKRTGKFSPEKNREVLLGGRQRGRGRGPQRGADPGGHGFAGDGEAGVVSAGAVGIRDGGGGAHRHRGRGAGEAGAIARG